MAKEKRSATIATHHGTKVSIRHNRRDPEVVTKEDHIDLSRPHEVWHEKPLEQVYEECFGDAIREYDAGQKRASRRIGGVQGYMEQIQRERAEAELYNEKAKAENKAHENDPGWKPKRPKAAAALVYEEIAGIYQQGGPELTTDEKKALLKEYADGWQQRNPSMALVGVYYHEDEEGKDPHLHIDYVPVGTGYQRGPKAQNSLERACNTMGYKSMGVSATAQIQWQAAENDFLQKLCEAHDIEVLRPQAGKKSKHKSTAQYKLEQRLKEAEARNKELEEKNKKLEKQVEGFLFRPIFRKAKQRREEAERAADEAEARQAEAEARQAEAEAERDKALQEAEEARRSAEEVRKQAKAEQDRARKERAATESARQAMAAEVQKAERIRQHWERVGQSEKGSETVLRYLRLTKTADGKRTLYDDCYHKAIYSERQVAKKQAGIVDALIADANDRLKSSRKLPDISDIKRQRDDDGLSL